MDENLKIKIYNTILIAMEINFDEVWGYKNVKTLKVLHIKFWEYIIRKSVAICLVERKLERHPWKTEMVTLIGYQPPPPGLAPGPLIFSIKNPMPGIAFQCKTPSPGSETKQNPHLRA